MHPVHQDDQAYLLPALAWAPCCCVAEPFDWRASNDLVSVAASSRRHGSCASSVALSILISAMRSTRWLFVCAAGAGTGTAAGDGTELRFRAAPLRFLGAETVAIVKHLKDDFLMSESAKKGLFPTGQTDPDVCRNVGNKDGEALRYRRTPTQTDNLVCYGWNKARSSQSFHWHCCKRTSYRFCPLPLSAYTLGGL